VTDPRPRELHQRLGSILQDGWRDSTPWGYPHQVELALIAGVFRAQTSQANVDQLVDTVMRSRVHSLLDDLAELANSGTKGIVTLLGPRWGDANVLGVPVMRASVIHDAAVALVALGVRSANDLRAAALKTPDAVEAAVLGVRGIGPGTWAWIAFLAHVPVRPGTKTISFVSEAVGEGERLSADETAELLRLTARRFASDERVLAHAVHTYLDARDH
jgi:hypothetical protein